MKKVFQGVCVVMILAISGCGTNEKKDDLLNYINNELSKIIDIENAVIVGYDAVSGGNDMDDDEMYEALEKKIIPNSLKLIKLAETIMPKTRELRAIHEIYLEAINTQRQALVMILSVFEKEDSSLVDQANEKLADARKSARDFLLELREYAKKNNVTIRYQKFDNERTAVGSDTCANKI